MNIREFRDYIKSTKQDDFYTLDYCGLKFRLFEDDKVIVSYKERTTRYDLIFFLSNPNKWDNLFIIKYHIDVKKHRALLLIDLDDKLEYEDNPEDKVSFSMKII
nr:MAG TPA: hypothetical protein [Caudoviricetes sp.]